MVLPVMGDTKMAGACFLHFRMLYHWGGGICGGGTLPTLGVVTGYGGIVWMTGGDITLGCVFACSHKGDIIDTLGSRIVTCGVGYVGIRLQIF